MEFSFFGISFFFFVFFFLKNSFTTPPTTHPFVMANIQGDHDDEIPLLTPTREEKERLLPEEEEEEDSLFEEHIKSIVFGGLDGVVSIFVGVLVSVVAGQHAVAIVLALSISKLFAGAFSMGVGDMLSTKAEVDYARGERRREAWELENFPEGEIEEMIELYVGLGYKKETAHRMVEIMKRDEKLFVDMMMVEELGIPPDQETQNPYLAGAINFTSFLIFGLLPVLPFLIVLIGVAITDPDYDSSGDVIEKGWRDIWIPLGVSGAITLLGLVILALLKARVTGMSPEKSLVQTLGGGILSAGVGGIIGYSFFVAFGLEL